MMFMYGEVGSMRNEGTQPVSEAVHAFAWRDWSKAWKSRL